MRVGLIATLCLLGCSDPDNPCNNGGPQSLTLGTYDGSTFTPWEEGEVMLITQVDAASQGGSFIMPGLTVAWLSTGVKPKPTDLRVNITVDGDEVSSVSGAKEKMTCIADVGSVATMDVGFATDKSDVDLIGLDVDIQIDGTFSNASLNDAVSGQLDLEF